MNQTIQLLNGDTNLFFRNKINQIPQNKNILETILKWKHKTYKRSFDVIENGKPKTITKEFKIKDIQTKHLNSDTTDLKIVLILSNGSKMFVYAHSLYGLSYIQY